MSQVWNDLRFAVRSLSRVPGFALVAVLTLALGIGANTAIFSVVNGVILKPLGYPHPEQLVMITSQFPTLGFDQFWVSPPEYFEFRERNKSFKDVGAYTTNAVNIGSEGQPQRVAAAGVTSSLLNVLAVPPRVGRVFAPEDNLPNAAPVVILSDELWRSAYAARNSIVGEQIDVDGVKRTVIGIMPPGVDIHDQGVKIWLPITLDPTVRTNRGSHFLYLVGRLHPGVTLARAKVELESLLNGWGASLGATPTNGVHVPTSKNHRIRYDDLQADVVGNVRTALWVLQAAVGFVLLIACANMANLLLMRAEARHKELAVRAALGAGRGRLLRQFMAESVVLSLAGGISGLLLAQWGVRALLAANSGSIPRSAAVGIDLKVLVFTLLVALATGVLFGLAPLLHLSGDSVGLALRDGGSRTTSSISRNRVRRGLVAAEVALAVMLVVGAGLLLRSFWNLMRVDSGFDRSRLTTFNVVLPAAPYSDFNRRVAFFANLTSRLDALPGVDGAAAMSGLPPRRQVNANDTDFEGVAQQEGGPAHNVDYYQNVTAAYVPTMGIPIVAGRAFSASDDQAATPVAMINETLAKVFYPNTSPIGRRIKPSGVPDSLWFTIVGVVKDVKQGGVDQKTGTELYFHIPQLPRTQGFAPRNMNIVLRSKLGPSALASSIRREVSALDPTLPIVSLRSMDDVFSDSVSRPRFLAQLLGIFASVALLLAAIGTYGILAYSVTERRHEIGIRMALGADRRGVLTMVIRQGLTVTLAGLVVGLVGAIAVSRLASSLLFGVKPTDPLTFVSVSAFIVAVAIVACLVPARRATRVDPLSALRG